ncbi:DUF3558 domain-containing protein [Nocardia sp. NPDC059180]|uniref:DUF3558 domain-containing protein n=1 Tax=Nocardia sp. NPDC059180 TaxID=3346761 RepID=UPI00369A8F77
MTRINRHIVAGALLACSVLVLAGCSGSSGEARPADGGAAASTTVSAATTTTATGATGENGGPAGESGGSAPAPEDGGSEPEASPAPSEGSGAPEADPVSTEVPTGLWDPCALPGDALAGAGLDASTERSIPGAWRPDWLTCQWQSSSGAFDLTMESTDRSLDAVRQDPEFKQFAQVFVGGRDALKYRSIQDVKNSTCAVSVAVPDGSVMFSVRMHGETTVGEACGHAAVVGEALVGHLP